VLQRVAEGCRGLQRVAEGCRGLRRVAEGCRGLQRVAEGCSVWHGDEEMHTSKYGVMCMAYPLPLCVEEHSWQFGVFLSFCVSIQTHAHFV